MIHLGTWPWDLSRQVVGLGTHHLIRLGSHHTHRNQSDPSLRIQCSLHFLRNLDLPQRHNLGYERKSLGHLAF